MTIHRINPGTSSKTPPSSGTNPYRVVFAGATSGSLRSGVRIGQITVEGYDGHNSHGLTVGYTTGAEVFDVTVLGNLGSGSSPPAETFSLELWHAYNAYVHDCHVDGENVAATLIGMNDVDGSIIENCVANRTTKAFASANWRCGGEQANPFVYRNCDFRYARRPYNQEQPYGWTRIENCDFRNRTSNTDPDIVFASSGLRSGVNSATNPPAHGPLAGTTQGSAHLTVVEPVWDRSVKPFVVGVPTIGSTYGVTGQPHLQDPRDVTVIIDGVSYTPNSSSGQVWTVGGWTVGSQTGYKLKIGNYWGNQT